MPYFAQIQNNEVLRVIVADDIAWCQSRLGGAWIETAHDSSIRKNYAGISYEYRADIDAFVPPQPAYNMQLDGETAQWTFPLGTDVIYVPIATEAAIPLSQALYFLVYPRKQGMYCGVVPHPTRPEVATLQLRTTDIIPIALGSNPSPLAAILKPFVDAGSLTQQELDGIVAGVQAMAGQSITVQQFIPASWQQWVMTHEQAIQLGWLND